MHCKLAQQTTLPLLYDVLHRSWASAIVNLCSIAALLTALNQGCTRAVPGLAADSPVPELYLGLLLTGLYQGCTRACCWLGAVLLVRRDVQAQVYCL